MASLNIIDCRCKTLNSFKLPEPMSSKACSQVPNQRKVKTISTENPDKDIVQDIKESLTTFKSLNETLSFFKENKDWENIYQDWFDSKTDRSITTITVEESTLNFFSPNGYCLLKVKKRKHGCLKPPSKESANKPQSPVTVIADPHFK